ncbi:hypothetical protein niasHT_030837 [Heterodera trifolii]|uniref:Uncharacterized protein n=1 Tax=Heterodera trifolii TaxID=157864 RepID=A0ABD2HUA4_9BILA
MDPSLGGRGDCTAHSTRTEQQQTRQNPAAVVVWSSSSLFAASSIPPGDWLGGEQRTFVRSSTDPILLQAPPHQSVLCYTHPQNKTPIIATTAKRRRRRWWRRVAFDSTHFNTTTTTNGREQSSRGIQRMDGQNKTRKLGEGGGGVFRPRVPPRFCGHILRKIIKFGDGSTGGMCGEMGNDDDATMCCCCLLLVVVVVVKRWPRRPPDERGGGGGGALME